MLRRYLSTVLLVLSLLSNALGQQPAQTSATPQEGEPPADQVVRVNTNLVLVDAVVTDKNGKQVTDLKPEDFELFEDGRAQQITGFSYISTQSTALVPPATSLQKTGPSRNTPPTPPVRLRPEQVRRTIALVVDDLGLSFDSMAFVRQALKKFVAEQMQPTDLVAVIRTSGGMGAMQQFTSNKSHLNAAIDHIKWYPLGRARPSGVASLSPHDHGITGLPLTGYRDSFQLNVSGKEFFGGTVGALTFIARGLRDFPGRKSILLVSDNLPITTRDALSSGIMNSLKNLTEQANRSAVVIYTLDPRGLPKVNMTADDSQYNLAANQINPRLMQRRMAFTVAQDGLNYLAAQTGGLFFRGTNDLNDAFNQVLDDQKGYYLLAYKPDDATLRSKGGVRDFHRLDVKVNQPGLVVRARKGFYTTPGTGPHAPNPSNKVQLLETLNSPFASGDIRMRMTSLFANDQTQGSYVRTLFHVDARDISFSEGTDGWYKAVFDVATFTFDDNGKPIDLFARAHTMRVRAESYQQLLQDGFVYFTNLPVKKPGAYQLRAVLRDRTSSRVGSASQFLEVPNLNDNRLALSGLIVNGVNASEGIRAVSNRSGGADTGNAPSDAHIALNNGSKDAGATRMSPAVRQFQRGEMLEFGYYIYNARRDAMRHARLQTQLRLFREGQPIFIGKMLPFDVDQQADMKRIVAGGNLQLGTDLTPGEYVLQVIVIDLLADEAHRMTTQWISLEILS